MAVNLICTAVGAAIGWSAAMFVVWLRDAGIVEFWRIRFLDEEGEGM